MAEGVTAAHEALRLGMIGEPDGPYFGRGHPDVVAAYLVGELFRFFAGLELYPELVDDEMVEWESLAWDEAPYVCPGCHAVAEPCALGCIDRELRDEDDAMDLEDRLDDALDNPNGGDGDGW